MSIISNHLFRIEPRIQFLLAKIPEPQAGRPQIQPFPVGQFRYGGSLLIADHRVESCDQHERPSRYSFIRVLSAFRPQMQRSRKESRDSDRSLTDCKKL